MIKVTEIRDSKSNPDWIIVVLSNPVDELAKITAESKGFNYRPKSCTVPVLREKNQFKLGQEFPNKEIFTESSETAFWEEQEPNEKTGLYYRNVIGTAV